MNIIKYPSSENSIEVLVNADVRTPLTVKRQNDVLIIKLPQIEARSQEIAVCCISEK